MTFSPDLRTRGNGKTYSKTSNPEKVLSAENTVSTSASSYSEHIDERANKISLELIEERIKAILGPVNEQISTLTQLLNPLIQESSARNSPTADTCTQQTQARRSLSREAGTSRALSAREIGRTGYPPNKC